MNPRYKQLADERNLHYDGKHLPYDPALKGKARDLRNNATPEERILWKAIRRSPFQVLRQRTIDHFIVDFYIPSKRLVIEIDGGQHYSEDGLKKDENRTRILELYGLTVLRVSNREVRQNAANIANYILSLPEKSEE